MAEPRFMNPVDELRAAAAKLRATAAAVPFGPPWTSDADLTREVVSGDVQPWGAPSVALASTPEAATWIALASPASADPIATWLEAEADTWPTAPAHTSTEPAARRRRAAIAQARLINGTAPFRGEEAGR